MHVFNRQAPPAVHVLLEGAPLCGLLWGVPRDWPEGNRWVALNELADATCPICKERAAAR